MADMLAVLLCVCYGMVTILTVSGPQAASENRGFLYDA